jgi:hypothetical protein
MNPLFHSSSSLKRERSTGSVSNDLDTRDFKRPKFRHSEDEDRPFLPPELLTHVFNFCDFQTQGRVAQSSQACNQLIHHLPIWVDCCNEADLSFSYDTESKRRLFMQAYSRGNQKALLVFSRLYAKGVYFKKNLPESIRCLDRILRFSPPYRDVEAQALLRKASLCLSLFRNRIEYVSAIALLSSVQQIQTIEPKLQGKIDLMRARLILEIDHPRPNPHIQESYALLLRTSQNPHVSSKKQAQANLLRAIMRVDEYTSAIADQQAFDLLTESSQNPFLSSRDRHLASLYMGIMRVLNRTEDLTDVNANSLLFEASIDNEIGHNAVLRAKVYLATMAFEGRSNQYTLLSADRNLAKLTRDSNLDRKMCGFADFIRAKIQFALDAPRLTDKTIKKLLINASTNTRLPHRITAAAVFLRAKMCVERRSFEFTIDRIYQILTDATQNIELDVNTRAMADILRVRMRAEGTIDTHLSEVEASRLLSDVSQNEDISIQVKAAADLLRVRILIEGLMGRIDDSQGQTLTDSSAYALLSKISQSDEYGFNERAHADLLRAYMCVKKRCDDLTDRKAYALLMGLNGSCRLEARLLIAQMGAEGRTDQMTDEKAFESLVNLAREWGLRRDKSDWAGYLAARMRLDGRSDDSSRDELIITCLQNVFEGPRVPSQIKVPPG